MLLVEFLLAYATCKGSYTLYSQCFPLGNRPSEKHVDRALLNEDVPLNKPFEELCKALGDESVPEQPPKKRTKLNTKSETLKHPKVDLAFDEVYILTKPRGNGSWSRFGEIPRAIRGLLSQPMFTLFLSASGTLFGIGAPAPGRDISTRMFREWEVMMPFCELGFDKFAKHLDFCKPIKLTQITSDGHLTLYG